MINEEESDKSLSKDYVSPRFFDFDKMNYENQIPKLALNFESPRFELQSDFN